MREWRRVRGKQRFSSRQQTAGAAAAASAAATQAAVNSSRLEQEAAHSVVTCSSACQCPPALFDRVQFEDGASGLLGLPCCKS